MAPIVHGLEADYSDRMVFTYLDIDDPRNDQFKQVLGFRVQPQFILLDGDGDILKQWIGPVTANDFIQAFESALE